MSDRELAAELLWQRDECRAKCERIEREHQRLTMLLGYAEAAMREEYRLRIAEHNGASLGDDNVR